MTPRHNHLESGLEPEFETVVEDPTRTNIGPEPRGRSLVNRRPAHSPDSGKERGRKIIYNEHPLTPSKTDQHRHAQHEKVMGVLGSSAHRARHSPYMFTDQKGAFEYPERRVAAEVEHAKRVAGARKVVVDHGGDAQQFDARLHADNEKFLERRRAEEMPLAGDTVEELLRTVSKVPYLKQAFVSVVNFSKQEQKKERAKLSWFGRLKARVGDVRHMLGNDFNHQSYDIMSKVVARVNAQHKNGVEAFRGKDLLTALRAEYPQVNLG